MDKQGVEVLFQGRHIRLLRKGNWEYIERRNITGIVSILPVTDDGKIVLIQQFRQPLGKDVIELPAGLVGDTLSQEDESLEAAAMRELLEETGYQAQAMEFITAGPPAPGSTSEVITLFRAKGLKKVGPGGGDGSEDIKVIEIPLQDAHEWLEDAEKNKNVLIDPKIYTGLYFAGRNGSKSR